MSLKLSITNLDDVPEGIRAFYEKQPDGTYTLAVDDSDTKTRINEFRDNNIKLQKKTAELEAAMKRYDGIDPAKWGEAQEALNKLKAMEEEKLRKTGDVDAIVKAKLDSAMLAAQRQIDTLTKEVSARDEKLVGMTDAYHNLILQTMVAKAANSVGSVRSGAMDDINYRAKNELTIDTSDGAPRIVIRDGITIADAKGNQVRDLDGWVGSLVSRAPYLFESGSGGGAGGGSRGNRTPNNVAVLTNPTPEELGRHAADVAAGKIKVVMTPGA